MTTPQYQTYAQTMSRLAERHPPAPTPAEVRNQPAMIPGVLSQTTNLFRPVLWQISIRNQNNGYSSRQRRSQRTVDHR